MQAMNLDEDDSLIKDSPTADCSRGRESMKCFQSVQLEKTKRNFGSPEEEGDGSCEIIPTNFVSLLLNLFPAK
jgi:hypothetical protein